MNCRVLCILGFSAASSCLAIPAVSQPDPGAIRVINLGNQVITAFTIVGLQFHEVGLYRSPGDVLTPAFGTDATIYKLYWRLQDGSINEDIIDLLRELPTAADGDAVVLSIHDDHVEVTWSMLDPAWREFSRVGDPKIVSKPDVHRFSDCSGPLIEHPIGKKAWNEAADRLRSRSENDQQLTRTLINFRCALDWYIPRSNRERESLGEQKREQLRKEWYAEIRQYKQQLLPEQQGEQKDQELEERFRAEWGAEAELYISQD